MSFADFYKHE